MAESVFKLRWGILGAGWISGVFVKDIILHPNTRGVTDVIHEFVAIGSRDAQKAKQWIAEKTGQADHPAKAYGSYEEVVSDPEVDAVYIGVPHPGHYDLVVLALNHGKHVLCEKPCTVNANETKALFKLAKEKNLFLMEAMWTRFLPVAQYIADLVHKGTLGDVKVVHADLSGDFDVANIPLTHRILDPKLGGGALLDLGPYPMIWAIAALYEHPSNERTSPSHVSGSILKTPLTGVDEHTSFTLTFDKLAAQAILSCGITVSTPNPALVIRCRKGNILVDAPIYRPHTVRVQYLEKAGGETVEREEVTKWPNGSKEGDNVQGGGWHYQADEVARCVRDGKIESNVWGSDKTILQMEVFDQVRKQGGLLYPEGTEKVPM